MYFLRSWSRNSKTKTNFAEEQNTSNNLTTFT